MRSSPNCSPTSKRPRYWSGIRSAATWLCAYAATRPDDVGGVVVLNTGPGYRDPVKREEWNERSKRNAHRFGVPVQVTTLNLQEDSVVMDRLADMTTPTLVLAGSEDRAEYTGAGEYLERKMPDARLAIVEGGGHSMHEDSHAGEVAELIAKLVEPRQRLSVDVADSGHAPSSPPSSTRFLRSTFPVGLRGSSSTNVTCRGTLCRASCSRTSDRTSSVVSDAPGRTTTNATSACPNRSSGTPTTATSWMSGCWPNSSSTSIGNTFSPPDTIMSSSRPSMNKQPVVEVTEVAGRQQAAPLLLAATGRVAVEPHRSADEDPAHRSFGHRFTLIVQDLDLHAEGHASGGGRCAAQVVGGRDRGDRHLGRAVEVVEHRPEPIENRRGEPAPECGSARGDDPQVGRGHLVEHVAG